MADDGGSSSRNERAGGWLKRLRAQMTGEQTQLRGLAAAVDALEDDESPAVHARLETA